MMATEARVLVVQKVTSQSRRQAVLEDGLAHGGRIFPRDPRPGQPVTLVVTANAALPIDLVAIYYTTDGAEPQGERGKATAGTALVAEAGPRENDPATGRAVREWRVTIPAQPEGTLVRYRAEGWAVRGARRVWHADHADAAGGPPEDGRVFAYSVDNGTAPEWLDDAIIYHIAVDRFSAGHDEPPLRDPGDARGVFGGTLAGILERLDYIERLGVTCLWLTPVFATPTPDEFHPASFYYVAERFGTNETLKRLIAEAHQREMKVMLDFVASHTATDHPLFQRARTEAQSPLRAWYTFGDFPPYGYRTHAAGSDMPELATEHPDVRRYLAMAARFWLSDLGADGLRLVDASGVSHAFWSAFQREIKSRFPQALTLGELPTPPTEAMTYAGRMDAVVDIELAAMLRQVFAQRAEPLDALLRFLDEHEARFAGFERATPLEDQRTPRFLALAGGVKARLRLAATCLMTLDGMPILSYGTEVGLSRPSGGNLERAEPEGATVRAPMPAMPWGDAQDHELLAHFQALCALRRGHPALRHGRRVRLAVEVVRGPADALSQVGAYLRLSDADYLVVVLNNAEAPVTLRVALAEGLAAVEGGARIGVALGHRLGAGSAGELAVEHGIFQVELPALGAAVLGPQ